MKNRNSIIALVLTAVLPVTAQFDQSRMDRDIEVAENVLQTLIRQQFQGNRTFFPLSIEGSYQPGYGVTFRFPANYTTPLTLTMGDNRIVIGGFPFDDEEWEINRRKLEGELRLEIDSEIRNEIEDEIRLNDRKKTRRNHLSPDSLQQAFNQKLTEAARTFLLDYHHMLSQLPANEKIVITNRGEHPRMWVSRYTSTPNRVLLEIEVTKADLNQYSSGKLTREQMLNRITVVNTQTTETTEPDLELLASILSRLYRSDLSKTFFTDNPVYYERLKNFGVVYYLKVYSSTQHGDKYNMPTLKLSNVDADTRAQKVKEIYPKFEQELKENLLEYGRTLKTLKEDDYRTLEKLATNPKVVAYGEIGLDYYYMHSPKDLQQKHFREQIRLSRRLGLPLVIHTREAWKDTFAILAAEGAPERTVFHCFSGGPDEARRCLDLGAFLSFSGIVTFKSAAEVADAAARCPLDRLLVETDAPYLAPVPHRGKRNTPAWVPLIGEAIAALKGLSPAAVAEATWETTAAVYGLDR